MNANLPPWFLSASSVATFADRGVSKAAEGMGECFWVLGMYFLSADLGRPGVSQMHCPEARKGGELGRNATAH